MPRALGVPSASPASLAGGGAAAWSPDYLRGYRDAVNSPTTCPGRPRRRCPLADGLAARRDAGHLGPAGDLGRQLAARPARIRVAVLDTGFDLQHPDFAGRAINQVVRHRRDGAGRPRPRHALHRHGLRAAAPASEPPRYGVAVDAEIFAGKVLTNQGSGSDGGILAGIEWAIANECAVVSMSLGAPTQPTRRSRRTSGSARRARRAR